MKIPIINNPSAGSAFQKTVSYVKSILGHEDFYYVNTSNREQIKSIVSEEKKQGNRCCGIRSGDGGIWIVINELPEQGILLIDPTGTSNNLARSLEKECEKKYSEIFSEQYKREVNLADYVIDADLLEIRQGNKKAEYAATTASVGLTAAICYEVEKNYQKNLFGKKLPFAQKTLSMKKKFEPLRVEYSLNNSSKHVTLENLLAFEIANVSCVAGMPAFNQGETLGSGTAGLFFIQDKGYLGWMNLLFNAKVLQNTRHLTSGKGHDGFNNLGIKYMNMKSLEIRILDAEEGMGNKDFFLEMDGEPRKFDPKETLKIEVKPRAIKLVYLPWILEMFGKKTRIYFEEK